MGELTKDELKEKLDGLGVVYDKRLGEDKLRELYNSKLPTDSVEEVEETKMTTEKTVKIKYIMRMNINHDKVRYAQGGDCPAELLEKFKEWGFVEEVRI